MLFTVKKNKQKTPNYHNRSKITNIHSNFNSFINSINHIYSFIYLFNNFSKESKFISI